MIMPKKRHQYSRTFSFGDNEWVGGFFAANYYSFLSFAIKYISDSTVAEDILQDTVIKLIVASKEFGQENEAKLYIYRTIRNRCLNYIRDERAKSDQGMLSDNTAEEQHDAFFYYILEEELFSRLFEEIDKLPGKTRNVLLLTLEGKRNLEIAAHLEIGIETVKTHKKIGKDLLRKRMNDLMYLFLLLWLSSQ